MPKMRDGAKQTGNERGDSQWIQNKGQNIEIRQHRRRFGNKKGGCAAKPLCRTGQTRPPKTFRRIKTSSLWTIKIRLNRRRPLGENDVQGWQRKARRTGMPVRPESVQLQGKVCRVQRAQATFSSAYVASNQADGSFAKDAGESAKAKLRVVGECVRASANRPS